MRTPMKAKKSWKLCSKNLLPDRRHCRAQNDELENLKKQLQAQGDKLSEEERGSRVRSATEKQKSLQRSAEDFQNEVQTAEQEILNRLGKKMLDVLEKYARENGFAVVMDVSNPQTPVLYANPGTNITKNLIEAYNTESPGGASAQTSSNQARGRCCHTASRFRRSYAKEAVNFRRWMELTP